MIGDKSHFLAMLIVYAFTKIIDTRPFCLLLVEPSPRKTSLSLIILVASIIVIVLIALLCTTLYYLYLRRKSVAKLRGN